MHKKTCVSVALGFDSYAVIRHGVAADDASEPHLGCYFCRFMPPVPALTVLLQLPHHFTALASCRRCSGIKP